MTRQPPDTSPERIERLQRRRTRLTFTQAILFLFWQMTYFAQFADDSTPARQAVHHAKISAYIVWVALLLAFLATGGEWWSGRHVRAILNDEVTQAHRGRAMAVGFYGAMGAGLGCYVVTLFEPMNGQVAIHAILSTAIGAALLTFGVLERRAQRLG